jgi:ABC-2 type transport system ATP-binding protein
MPALESILTGISSLEVRRTSMAALVHSAASNLPPVTAAGRLAPAVRVRGLTKSYGDTRALDGLDLEVAPGELRGLLGPNGAGKTTLLRALFGLIRPQSGSVELLGRPLAGRRVATLGGVAGFVEEPRFYPFLSGRANLELLRELDDVDDAMLDDALGRVGLSARARDRVGHYSTGMRQRLGIAAALVRRPRLLLLDEPTSGLDPAGIRAVSALLREVTADGVAVILSSHLIGELEAICHSYTIIRAGRVVWDGSASRMEAEVQGSIYSLATSDDGRAAGLARGQPGLRMEPVREGGGLRVQASVEALDRFTASLGREGIGVRRLERVVTPLEQLFFSLTAEEPGAGVVEQAAAG